MPIAQMRRYAELARGWDETLAERMRLLTENGALVRQRIAAERLGHLRNADHVFPKVGEGSDALLLALAAVIVLALAGACPSAITTLGGRNLLMRYRQ
jgi:hypothetical protein